MSKQFKLRKAKELSFVEASSDYQADSYFHFSLASYNNAKNKNYGVLRLLNDEEIAPYDGFPRHPHQDVEIISYVVEGELTFKNSFSRKKGILGKGDVQAVTAGTGVWHSELNETEDPTRVIQIWLQPNMESLRTRYEFRQFKPSDRLNKLLHIVGNPSNKRMVPLHIEQDVNVFVSELTNKKTQLSFSLKAGRQAYINNFEGSLIVKDIATLEERDSMTITGPATLEFKLEKDHAHFIIVEMYKPRS